MSIDGNFERASMVQSLSGVTGVGNNAVFTGAPLITKSEAGTAWLEVAFAINGVAGLTPQIHIPYAGEYFGAWSGYSPNRKGMWSPDGINWNYFTNSSINSGAGRIEMQHSTPFPSNRIYIARSRQFSVHACGLWLASLAAAYPTLIGPAPSAIAHTPTGAMAGFAAQEFIAKENTPQTQLYVLTVGGANQTGNVIPSMPLYAAEINDASLMPAGGAPKRLAVITGGCHAGEDLGDWGMKYAVQHLLGNSTEAQYLRQHFRTLIYPLMNPMGRAGGHFRSQFQIATLSPNGDDLNRNAHRTPAGMEVVDFLRACFVTDFAGEVPVWHHDYHGTYLSRWSLAYDDSYQLNVDFKNALNVNFPPHGVTRDAGMPVGCLNYYMRTVLGVTMSLTSELGDQTPMTEEHLNQWGVAMIKTTYDFDLAGKFA